MTDKATLDPSPFARLSALLVVVLLALSLSPPGAADDTASKAKQLLDSGYQHLASGNPKKATKKFRRALELTEGRRVEPLVALAEAALVVGEYDEASEWSSRASEQADDARSRALVDRVVALTSFRLARDNRLHEETKGHRVKLKVRAELLLEQAIPQLGESMPQIWFDLARVLADQRRFPQALNALENYFSKEPSAASNLEASQLDCWLETVTSDYAAAWSADSVVTPPKKIYDPPAQLTPAARRAGVRAVVILDGFIDDEGKACYRVASGLPFGLTESTLETVSTWRFEPATVDGKPVTVPYNVAVSLRTN